MKSLNSFRKSIWLKAILGLLIFAIPFWRVRVGVDFADVGYNLSNYINFPKVNLTWLVSTFVPIALGKVFSVLPFGNTMLGMNICCTALFSLFLVFVFAFFADKGYTIQAFIGVLIASLLAWCPYLILYHYLSYFLFSIGALILSDGLCKDNKKKVVIAGTVLALNVFVKFPNVLDISLGILIIGDMFFEKKKRVREILVFLAGYFSMIAIGILTVDIFLGFGSFGKMIAGLFGISENAGSYSPVSMISSIIEGYRWDFAYFSVLLALVIIGIFFEKMISKEKYRIVVGSGVLLMTLFVIRVMKYFGRFSFDYKDLYSYYGLAVVAILLCLATDIFALFNSKESSEKRLWALASAVIILITPIGSNNGLATLINNLFIVFPIALIIATGEMNFSECRKSVVAVAFAFCAVLLFQGCMFRTKNVFREPVYDGKSFVAITANARLRNMQTTPEKKDAIEPMTKFLSDEGLSGTPTVFYGDSPIASYAFDLPNAISHVWPMLDSYPVSEFEEELWGLEENPLVMYSSFCGDLLDDFSERSGKEAILADYLIANEYCEIYRNGMFVLCMKR